MAKTKKYQHSEAFMDKAYAKYQAEVKARGGTGLGRNNFEAAYELYQAQNKKSIEQGHGRKFRDIGDALVYDQFHDTRFNTARAEYKALKGLGMKPKMKDLQGMTTQEFYDANKGLIEDYYKQKISEGMSTKEARKAVSKFFFGSK